MWGHAQTDDRHVRRYVNFDFGLQLRNELPVYNHTGDERPNRNHSSQYGLERQCLGKLVELPLSQLPPSILARRRRASAPLRKSSKRAA